MTVASTLTYENLPELTAQYRKQNKRIVLTQGTFDMLHIGHARYLEEAKSQGDVLIVGVDSDAKVRARKGPDRPIVPEDERQEMLSHLRSVDHVVLKPECAGRWELIKLVCPDVLIATTKTYNDAELAELKQYCKKVVVLEPMATTSTSAKLRLVQVGAAKKIEKTLSTKLIKAIEEVLSELKTE
ncbi:MAG: adenylyltransferase/cytidyltransferase family protein [Candidatus Pacebacteria bacterium]|nr:adenylyltransferase/cytidyltransferase family protein [Candidatus Paceibacterota bacterium]